MFTTHFHFKVKPAASIKIGYITVHALAIFVLFLSNIPVFLRLMLWLLIVASLIITLKRTQVFYQVIHHKNQWWVSTSTCYSQATQKVHPCRLLTPIFMSRALIILRMRPLFDIQTANKTQTLNSAQTPNKKGAPNQKKICQNKFKRPKTITILITPQSIDRQLFRRFLVFLRFYHRIEGGEHRIVRNGQRVGIIQRIVQSSAFFALQRTTDN